MVAVITGGTGLIGRQVARVLVEQGHEVRSLSRSSKPHPVPGVKTFQWNPQARQMDDQVLAGADVVIHLAGEGIADKRWTAERKRAIIESRTETAAFIAKKLEEVPNQVSTILSASGIGYYGYGSRPFNEDSPAAKDNFPAAVCERWEAAAHYMAGTTRRLVILRIGVVLSREGGAYPKLTSPIKLGIGTWLGSGEQVMSWIHIKDLAMLIAYAAQNPEMEGIYNAVAEEPVSQRFFLKQVARYMHRPLWPIGVPALFLEIALGNMAELVLEGSTVISTRLKDTGFRYRYPHLYEALADLNRKQKK
jgi:uncharacterized protein (TIGR01777 family)